MSIHYKCLIQHPTFIFHQSFLFPFTSLCCILLWNTHRHFDLYEHFYPLTITRSTTTSYISLTLTLNWRKPYDSLVMIASQNVLKAYSGPHFAACTRTQTHTHKHTCHFLCRQCVISILTPSVSHVNRWWVDADDIITTKENSLRGIIIEWLGSV